MQDINKVQFSDETLKALHKIVYESITRAIKNGTYTKLLENEKN
ncbi:hypothetical protein [Chengkuizengella marina]|nr:hypothetical protein [Chengkuizengella marina]